MILAGIYLIPDFAYMKHIVMLVGFLLMFFAPVILISTFLLSVLPRAKKEMDECVH